MKDGGVKSKIIKKYLPVMNQQINKYLQMMDFYINFTLDEEFKEVIKSPVHEDFSYESFSEGEKMRIDLALLFTWRDIAKMRNSASTNLLILDEIFDSSLDDAGTEFFTKIIRYVIQDAHVFVISHKTDGIIDQFDKVMRFDKVKGFSNYYRHLKKCHMTLGDQGFCRILDSYERKSMPVNKEIKGNLARLLATEDLVVEHKNVATASFNVDTRVLILPQWDRASNEVYDMLVGHEVGHALYTPNQDIPKSIPHQFVNVVEDARIEKLMKRRYGGLNKTFFRGYTELHEEDFFQVKDDDISTFNLADRANLYYKIGSLVDIPFFNVEESILIKRMGETETFEDVLEVARDLYEYCKQPEKEQEKVATKQNTESNAGGGEEPDDKPVDETLDESKPQQSPVDSHSPSDNDENIDEDLPSDLGGETDGEEPEVRTADNLEDSIRDLIQSMDQQENMYLEIPELNMKTVIADNKEVHDYIDNWWEVTERRIEDYTHEQIFGEVDNEFCKFKLRQKEVNYMVKEFECRKSADAYARALGGNGTLDCTKLHTYKYNEDSSRKSHDQRW